MREQNKMDSLVWQKLKQNRLILVQVVENDVIIIHIWKWVLMLFCQRLVILNSIH